jgi:hypothetical protein
MKPRKSASSRKKRAGTKPFSQETEVRAIARERVGTVKPSRPIRPKTLRKKPKHKLPPDALDQ